MGHATGFKYNISCISCYISEPKNPIDSNMLAPYFIKNKATPPNKAKGLQLSCISLI